MPSSPTMRYVIVHGLCVHIMCPCMQLLKPRLTRTCTGTCKWPLMGSFFFLLFLYRSLFRALIYLLVLPSADAAGMSQSRPWRIMLEKVADSAFFAPKLAEPYKPYGGQFLVSRCRGNEGLSQSPQPVLVAIFSTSKEGCWSFRSFHTSLATL